MDESKQQKARAYEKIRNLLFLFNLVVTVALLVASFSVGKEGGLSGWFARWIETWSPNVAVTVAVYTLGGLLAGTLIFLPVRFYSGFILEHRYELSTETVAGWTKDLLKSFAIDLVVAVLMLEVVYALIRGAGAFWWVWAAGAWILFAVVMSQLFPVLILPLFYQLKPVENQELVARLVSLAEKVKAKVLGVFVMDMSRKTKKANAMLAGLGKTKRIILGDTLLSQYTPEEIEVILAHELGHFYYRHLWKRLASGALLGFLGLYLVHLVLSFFVDWIGFRGLSDVANCPLLLLTLTLFFLVVMPLENMFSRYHERESDRFALNQTGNPSSFISSMKKLAEQNLANLEPNPVIEFLLHDHPSIGKRIRMAEELQTSGH